MQILNYFLILSISSSFLEFFVRAEPKSNHFSLRMILVFALQTQKYMPHNTLSEMVHMA